MSFLKKIVGRPADSHRLEHATENDPPIRIDPKIIKGGFCVFATSLDSFMTADRLHQALETNQSDFWKAVRHANPAIGVLKVMVASDADVDSFRVALTP